MFKTKFTYFGISSPYSLFGSKPSSLKYSNFGHMGLRVGVRGEEK